MDNGGKRKRVMEHPRIVYHAHNRTFDRLFKEKSLSEMQDVVRKKLDLPVDATFTLSQLRGDTFVDLEDDDDFEAFDALAHSSQSVEVRISVSDPSQDEDDDSSANARRRHVSFLERKDASNQQKTPTPEDAQPPPSKRRKLNNGKNEELQSEGDKSSNEATKDAKQGKKSKSVAKASNVRGAESITAALNISAAANSTEVETPVSRPKRRRASVTESTPASKLKEQVEATGAPELPPEKSKRKKVKHKKTAVDDGATADVETDSLNPPTNDDDPTKQRLPKQRRKSVSKPTNESKVDQQKDDASEKPSEPVKTRATTKTLAKQDVPQPTETSSSTTSKKKSIKKVTTDETSLPNAPRATSTSRKKTKATRPINDEPVSETFQAAAATLKSWSVAPADAAGPTPPPVPPAKATVKSSNVVVTKGEKKDKAKKVNGHSICPPPSTKDSAPESDIVPPVAGPSSGSRAKGGIVIRPDESSDSDSSSSDVPQQRRIVKKTTTKPTKEDKDLEAVVRGPKKSRASVARFLLQAEKEEARGVDGKDDDGEALEEEGEQKGRKKTLKKGKKAASSSSDSEDVEMEDLSKDTTPSPDLSQPPAVQVRPSVEEPLPPIQQTLEPAAEIVQEDVALTVLAPDSSDDIESTHTSPDAVDVIQPSHDFLTADYHTPTSTMKVMNRMKGKSPARTPSSSQTLTNGHGLFRLRNQSPAIARKLLGTASSSESSQPPLPPTSVLSLAKETQVEAQKDSQGSVARWTPLMPKSPSSVPDSTMEDELASSPQDMLKARLAEETQLPDPDQPALFLNSNTQTQFPYTQTAIRSPSPLRQQLPDSGEDEEENEVAAAVKVPAPQFRRLTEIEVSSRSMFARSARKKSSAASSNAGMRTRSMNNASLYGTLGSQRDDSDSDADSGSEEEKASHIPKSRRAGVK